MRLLQAAVVLSLFNFACNSSHSCSPEGQDPDQALGGVVYATGEEPPRALATGPFFITDVIIEGRVFDIFTSKDPACTERDIGSLFERNAPAEKTYEVQTHHGMRFAVATGKTLCLRSSLGQTKLVWSGSRN